MTRDYAKKPKTRRRRPKKTGVPGWVWLLTGILLGVLVSTLVQLAKVPEDDMEKAAQQTSEPDVLEEHSQKPRFNFYTLLKETEVMVPEGTDTERTMREAEANTVFLLQAGSFKNSKDADSLRASLLLMNLTANIETFKANNREIWYRVLVGPFENNSQVASAKSKLAANNIESLLLKRKK